MLAYDRIRRLSPEQLKAAQVRASFRAGGVQSKAEAQAILQAALGRRK